MKKNNKSFEKVKYCRICGYHPLKSFLKLGPLPTPNGYLTKEDIKNSEPKYPLTIGRCINCGLVQLTEIVRPDIMFRNYKYVPSASKTMIDHFDDMANDISKKNKLSNKNLVIDIGSNDGTLLKSFKKRGVKVLGIDPAENLAKIATEDGIETLAEFFNSKVASMVRKKYGAADVITGTNVVAHIPNLHSLFEGVNILLSNNGVFVMEFPYLVDLLENTEFDTIYQEHLSYFSIKPLTFLANKHGLYISDIQKQEVHGGSIRVFMKKGNKNTLSKPVLGFLALEDSKNLYSESIYNDFAEKVNIKKHQLMKLLKQLKKDKFTIIGLGASARGNILMNYFGIDKKFLNYIVDSTPYKHGLFTPGHHIPIFPESKILKDQPDYILLLAWNFKDEILKKQEEYRNRGGKFILITPEVEIV
jgi:SAM-dependent methyltransferase